MTEAQKKKISNALKGRPSNGLKFGYGQKEYRGEYTRERGEKIAQKIRGKRPWNYGKKGIYSEKTLEKMSLSHKGEKSFLWKGGRTFKSYSVDWTRTLRRSIRERDNYTCKICGAKQEDRAFSIHHIDYDKNNCDPNNLITLCVSCHAKTNCNRECWITFFRLFSYEGVKVIDLGS
jgi:hypothetical protein